MNRRSDVPPLPDASEPFLPGLFMGTSYPGDPQPWRVLHSAYVDRHPWFTVRRERVQLPGGSQIDDYFVYEYPPWVNVIARTVDRRIVMVRQFRHALSRVLFELPGGVGEFDEDPLESARRELLEETGYGGGKWHPWMVLAPNAALQTNLSHTYLALDVELLREQELEATEDITVHLVPEDELRQLVVEGHILQALHSAPLLKFLLTPV